MPSLQNNIHMTIRSKIFDIIMNDLTIGRENRGLQPLEDIEIRQFIISNLNNIYRAICVMVLDYDKDGDFNELLNPDPSWISEYLYEFVNTNC
jgi:hypothetical protein